MKSSYGDEVSNAGNAYFYGNFPLQRQMQDVQYVAAERP
jgi:hypothetical protein